MEIIKVTERLRSQTVFAMKHGDLPAFSQPAGTSKMKEEMGESSTSDYSEFPKFVTGIKGLAEVLSVSPSMGNRWKASGLLDEATCQNGKYVLFDVYGVLEILRVNNRKISLTLKIKEL